MTAQLQLIVPARYYSDEQIARWRKDFPNLTYEVSHDADGHLIEKFDLGLGRDGSYGRTGGPDPLLARVLAGKQIDAALLEVPSSRRCVDGEWMGTSSRSNTRSVSFVQQWAREIQDEERYHPQWVIDSARRQAEEVVNPPAMLYRRRSWMIWQRVAPTPAKTWRTMYILPDGTVRADKIAPAPWWCGLFPGSVRRAYRTAPRGYHVPSSS